MADGSTGNQAEIEPIGKSIKARLTALKNERQPFEPWWNDLNQYFKPSQARYTLTGENIGHRVKVSRYNNKVVRTTPLMARRIFQAGMMSGLTNPARPWVKLTTPDTGLNDFAPVKEWLYTVARRMHEIFAKGNLYQSLPLVYSNVGTLATASMLMLEDSEDLLRFYAQPMGTFWLAQNNRNVVDTLYRTFDFTVRQCAQEFDRARWSPRLANFVRDKKWEQTITILHAIEPKGYTDAVGRTFNSTYLEMGCDDQYVLGERSYYERPFAAPRWEADPDDVYGTDCPGMIAIGPARALMVQERRKAQAIDKLVAPPLMAPAGLRNQLIDNVAGGVTYYDDIQGREGIKSLYDVKPDLSAMIADIQETGGEIEEAFFVDLFLAISRMEGVQPRNEMEIFERKEEKLLLLGPGLQNMHEELLDPIVDRAFATMVRRSEPYWRGVLDGEPVIPPPPAELQGIPLTVEYTSILSQAMRTVGISGVDRVIGFVGNIATLTQNPRVWDKIDTDKAIEEMGDMLGINPSIIRDDADVAAMRDEAAAAQEQAAALQTAQTIDTMAGAAQKLGNASVTPDNALGKLAGA